MKVSRDRVTERLLIYRVPLTHHPDDDDDDDDDGDDDDNDGDGDGDDDGPNGPTEPPS